MSLKTSDNSKTRCVEGHYNAFAIKYGKPEHGGTCPGATLGKGGCLHVKEGGVNPCCYAAKLHKIYKGYALTVENNTREVTSATEEELVAKISEMIADWRLHCKPDRLFFRVHQEGDFFSAAYARAWVAVMKSNPDVKFWAYTRSLAFVPILAVVENLSLRVSCDPVNYRLARKVAAENGVPLAWMGEGQPPEVRWVDCPAITGKIRKGGLKTAGDCSKCHLCTGKYRLKQNIRFGIH